MDAATTSQLFVGILTSAAAIAGFVVEPGRLRNRLKHDVELLSQLPRNSKAHSDLVELVEAEIIRLHRTDIDGRREMPMFIVALVATPLTGWFAIWLWG